MVKYNIEGNIDFFSELYKSLDIEEKAEKTDEDKNLCLITNQPLLDKYVEMNCGHKFNYIPLFNDIKNHKQKFNGMEGSSTHLKTNEIRCPYCRTKQNSVLPYYEELVPKKINGVNSYDPTIVKSQTSGTKKYVVCEFLAVNPAFDPSGNHPIEKGTKYSNSNCKLYMCYHTAYYQIKNYIQEYNGEFNNVCCSHKNTILSQHKKDVKEKEKIEKIKAKEEAKKTKEETKQKEKEDAKKAKEEAKIKAKEEAKAKEDAKIKVKENKKKIKKVAVENVVLGSIIIDVVDTKCKEIFKSGPNKGKQCESKIYESCYCKRHIKNKQPSETMINEETLINEEKI